MKHKNIDIMDCEEFPEYDILYTDPPWENRMVKFFETQMRKDVGEAPSNDIDSIFHQLAKLANKERPMFIEYQIKGAERIRDIMCPYGHRMGVPVVRIQSNKQPYMIFPFNWDGVLPTSNAFKFISDLIVKFDSPIVFDPFAGIGQTCRAVKRGGGGYIGYELNPSRFKRMIKVAG